MKLSDHFTLAEASITEHREIDNSIPESLLPVISRAAVKMEKVRAILGDKSIHVNSWYRCPALNAAIGSKPTSDHLRGQAVDFVAPAFGSPLEICKALQNAAWALGFKQLILEHTWVHISWELTIPNATPKLEVLSLLSGGRFAVGLTDKNGNLLA